jgi:uncharacterized protein YpiB (UPF0302 family)
MSSIRVITRTIASEPATTQIESSAWSEARTNSYFENLLTRLNHIDHALQRNDREGAWNTFLEILRSASRGQSPLSDLQENSRALISERTIATYTNLLQLMLNELPQSLVHPGALVHPGDVLNAFKQCREMLKSNQSISSKEKLDLARLEARWTLSFGSAYGGEFGNANFLLRDALAEISKLRLLSTKESMVCNFELAYLFYEACEFVHAETYLHKGLSLSQVAPSASPIQFTESDIKILSEALSVAAAFGDSSALHRIVELISPQLSSLSNIIVPETLQHHLETIAHYSVLADLKMQKYNEVIRRTGDRDDSLPWTIPLAFCRAQAFAACGELQQAKTTLRSIFDSTLPRLESFDQTTSPLSPAIVNALIFYVELHENDRSEDLPWTIIKPVNEIATTFCTVAQKVRIFSSFIDYQISRIASEIDPNFKAVIHYVGQIDDFVTEMKISSSPREVNEALCGACMSRASFGLLRARIAYSSGDTEAASAALHYADSFIGPLKGIFTKLKTKVSKTENKEHPHQAERKRFEKLAHEISEFSRNQDNRH